MKTHGGPRGILTDPRDLQTVRARLQKGDARLKAVVSEVLRRAEKGLSVPCMSVTQNVRLPPSGDRHDYMSVATYWWPNPDTPDGLPYVRRDGEINPEFFGSDVDRIRRLCEAVQYLGLASAVVDDTRFAEKAAELVRHWFLAPDTKMNPHLSYAQFVPGVVEGRSYGIIDFKPVRELLDVVGLLPSSAWKASDQAALVEWMRAYLEWLTTSTFGRRESRQKNNHGTWFDAQALAVALFVEDFAVASSIVERAKGRIAQQITRAGEQPEELVRSRPLTYCMMNLQAFFDVATMAERCGVDLWNFESAEGSSLRRAADWLLPYVLGEKVYPIPDIVPEAPENYVSVFRRAALKFQNARFECVVERLGMKALSDGNVAHLLQFAAVPKSSAAEPSARPRASSSAPRPAAMWADAGRARWAGVPECNICGGTEFLDWKNRPRSRCARCHSQERTRVLKLLLDELPLGPGSRVLHIAPELGLATYLAERVGAGYEAVDINPARYKFANARKLNLISDVDALPSGHYDLVLHVHVMEHLRCDVTSVLFHLHRAIKPTGVHLCSIPILKGRYAAEFAPMTEERALREYGHKEHVRRFGADDIQQTLGMVFKLPQRYDLESRFPAALLDRFNIPELARRGWSPHSVLLLRKDDLKLRS